MTSDLSWVLDKGTVCFIDLLSDLDAAIKHGSKKEMTITFGDKRGNRYTQIASDDALLDAFEQYWDIKKLPITVTVSEDCEPPLSTAASCVEQQLEATKQSTIVSCVAQLVATQHNQVDKPSDRPDTTAAPNAPQPTNPSGYPWVSLTR